MTDTPNRPPLWRQMTDAYCDATDSVVRDMETIAIGTAAEIRALRDWLVPEEGPRPGLSYMGTRWDERQRLRAVLTAEADRAEQGEVEA